MQNYSSVHDRHIQMANAASYICMDFDVARGNGNVYSRTNHTTMIQCMLLPRKQRTTEPITFVCLWIGNQPQARVYG